MAEAGFYHSPSDNAPDVVICFLCQKELDGWEPQDIPWEEHKSHTTNCNFVKLGKKEEDMTIVEFMNMDTEMLENLVEIDAKRKIAALENSYKSSLKTIKKGK